MSCKRPPGRVPAYKRYLDEMPGVTLRDIWSDVGLIGSRAKERIGYPTQKALKLLRGIIEASTMRETQCSTPSAALPRRA